MGHVAIAVVTMPGGLVGHHQYLRDHHPDPGRRRDVERVLDDLRSLCRAARAYDEHDEHPTLIGCLEHAAGLHAQELDAATDRLAEERRLFYVATTRAKDRLLITHVAERGRRATGGPSRFLAEAGLHQTATPLAA